MNRTALVIAAALCFVLSSLARGERKVEYLKQEPPAGSVPYRKIVYVDDGTCPKERGQGDHRGKAHEVHSSQGSLREAAKLSPVCPSPTLIGRATLRYTAGP